MAVRILGIKFGRDRKKAPITATTSNLKADMQRVAYRHAFKMFSDDPNLLNEYVMENILHKKMPTIGERILNEELEKNPELRRQYAIMEMQRKGAEVADQFTQFTQQLRQMQAMKELIGVGGNSGAVDKLIDVGAGLMTSFLEGGGAEAIGNAVLGAQGAGEKRGRKPRVTIEGEQRASALPAANNPTATGQTEATAEEPVTLSDALATAVNNFVVMINYAIDGNPQYTPHQIAEYVLYMLNEITMKAQEIAQQTGEDDPVIDNLAILNDVIRKAPSQITSILSMVAMKEAKLRPLIKRIKTAEGQAVLQEICNERDAILANLESQGDEDE